MKLVYIARETIKALGVEAGQYVYVMPGALEDESDVIVATPLPRGRLGHVLGATLDGALELVSSDPPAFSQQPEEAIRQALLVSGDPAPAQPG